MGLKVQDFKWTERVKEDVLREEYELLWGMVSGWEDLVEPDKMCWEKVRIGE